jgi:hypothetical protein
VVGTGVVTGVGACVVVVTLAGCVVGDDAVDDGLVVVEVEPAAPPPREVEPAPTLVDGVPPVFFVRAGTLEPEPFVETVWDEGSVVVEETPSVGLVASVAASAFAAFAAWATNMPVARPELRKIA